MPQLSKCFCNHSLYFVKSNCNEKHLSFKIPRNNHWKSITKSHTEKKKNIFHCFTIFSSLVKGHTLAHGKERVSKKKTVTSKVILVHWWEHQQNKRFRHRAFWKTEKLSERNYTLLNILWNTHKYCFQCTFNMLIFFTYFPCHSIIDIPICAEYQWYLLHRQSTEK